MLLTPRPAFRRSLTRASPTHLPVRVDTDGITLRDMHGHVVGRRRRLSALGSREALARLLTTRPDIASVEPLAGGGGTGAQVHKVTFADGTVAVRKRPETLEEARAEYLTARVGEAIGAPVPAVVFDPTDESGRTVWMSYIDGVPGVQWLISSRAEPLALASEDAVLLGLLDVLTLNRDRHDKNWLMADGAIVGIDHGEAFRYDGVSLPTRNGPMALPEFRNGAVRARANRGQFAKFFASNDLGHGWVVDAGKVRPYRSRQEDTGPRLYGWRPNPLTPEQVAELGPLLAGLADEFRTNRRSYWHDDLMARWQQIARYASSEDPAIIAKEF